MVSSSCSLECLLHVSTDEVSSSLSVDHNGESFEVGEVGAEGLLLELEGSGRGIEGFLNLVSFEGLDDGGGTGTSEHGYNDLGESESLDRVLASGEVRGVNKDGVHVAHIDNDNAFAVIFSVGDPAYSTSLNVVSVDLYDEKNSQNMLITDFTYHLYFYIK